MSFFSRMATGGRSSNPQNNVGGVPEYEFGALYKSLDDLEFLETLGTGTFGRVRLVQHKLIWTCIRICTRCKQQLLLCLPAGRREAR